jgi:L-lactate dehydrogenase (cytochrome)
VGQRTKQGTVGVGRPFLYAFSAYGQDGVNKALQILHVSKMLSNHIPTYSLVKDEFEMNMRLLGARTMKDVVPQMVDASNIHSHIVAVPGDRLYDNNCKYLCII